MSKVGDHVEWDKKLRAFGLRTRNGKRTWIYQYKLNGKSCLARRRASLRKPQRASSRKPSLATALIRQLSGTKEGLKPNAATPYLGGAYSNLSQGQNGQPQRQQLQCHQEIFGRRRLLETTA
jgi:hypothetical protein